MVDFIAAPTDTETEPITIQGQVCRDGEYLGSVIDKLPWTPYIHAYYKKAQKKMSLLRKLQFFNVDQAIMQLFYQAMVQNAIFINLICFFGKQKR